MSLFARVARWFYDRINAFNPWECTICHRQSRDWADRILFRGRYVWMDNGFYAGKSEEMYCPEHRDWMPVPQDGSEARRRYYSGERQ